MGSRLAMFCGNTAAGAFIFLLSACAAAPVQRDAPRVGGFWEQDENTDPRFVHFDRPAEAAIGTLFTAGDNVFLNGQRISGTRPIINNSQVSTGFRSGARIEFERNAAGSCRIGILDFRTGRGFGATGRCLHRMRLPQGNGRTVVPTVYHLAVDGRRSEITVIGGEMEVWLGSNPAMRVTVGAGQDVLLAVDRIIGPRAVSAAEIERRIAWRQSFIFYEQTPDVGTMDWEPFIPLIEMLRKNRRDDDVGRSPPDTTDRSPKDDVTAPVIR